MFVCFFFSAGAAEQVTVSGSPWGDIGGDATLTCTPQNDILYMRWKNSSFSVSDVAAADSILRFVLPDDLNNEDDPHYVFDKASSTYPLTIKRLTLEDEMRYWCEVFFNATGAFAHDSHILRIRGTSVYILICNLRPTILTKCVAFVRDTETKRFFKTPAIVCVCL